MDDEVVSRLRVEAVDDTGPVLRGISEKIEKAKQTFEQLGSGLLLGKAFNDFANTQRVFERVGISANVTAQQVKGLKNELMEISKQTGAGIDELGRSFSTFMDVSGQAFGPAIEQFKEIAVASKVTGVSIEQLGRAIGAAASNMKVPADQLNDLLDRWSKEVPTTMLAQFTQMAPRLMQTMNSIGLTGKQNAEEIGVAFGQIAKASGSPRAAFMGLNELLNNMSNAGSQLGKIMLPTLEGVRAKGGDTLDMLDAMFNTLKQMGALDPGKQAWLQTTLGVDFNLVKTLQTLHDNLEQIRQSMRDGANAADWMRKKNQELGSDSKSALDAVKESVEEVGDSFAELMVDLGANQALKAVDDILQDIAATSRGVADIWNGNPLRGIEQISRAAGNVVLPDLVNKPKAEDYEGKPGAKSEVERAAGGVKNFLKNMPTSGMIPGLAGYAGGGVVTRPTAVNVAEEGPEAIVPLTGSSGGGGPSENTQATKENTAALNRLISYMRDSRTHRGLAYTPGAGEAGTPDVAQVYGGVGTGGHYDYGGGGPGSGPMFRPGIGPGLHTARGLPGGGSVPRHMGHSGTNTLSIDESTPSGSLSEQRKRMMKELNDDPQLRDFAIDAMQHEGGVQSNLEQLFNYAAMRHMTVRQALHSGQFGPVNTGQITGRLSASARAKGIAALQRVGAGSNITDYATDQGMRGDPNFAKYMDNRSYYDMHKVEGAWFSYHGEAGRRWAERQRHNDAQLAAAADHGARLSDMAQRHHHAGNSVFDHGAPPVPGMPNTSMLYNDELERHRSIGRRQRMSRIQSHFLGEDMLGAPRYASQLDIGFA